MLSTEEAFDKHKFPLLLGSQSENGINISFGGDIWGVLGGMKILAHGKGLLVYLGAKLRAYHLAFHNIH